jgi:hypothetical protein
LSYKGKNFISLDETGGAFKQRMKVAENRSKFFVPSSFFRPKCEKLFFENADGNDRRCLFENASGKAFFRAPTRAQPFYIRP